MRKVCTIDESSDDAARLSALLEEKELRKAASFDFFTELRDPRPRALPENYDELTALLEEFVDDPVDATRSNIQSFLGRERNWPKLLSARFQWTHILSARETTILQDIGNTIEAVIPSYVGVSKISCDNLWTRYAEGFLIAVAINKYLAAFLENEAEKCKVREFGRTIIVERTKASATYYDCGDYILVLADWQKHCSTIDIPLQQQQFRKVVRLMCEALILFWITNKEEEEAIFKELNVGSKRDTTAVKKGKALWKVEQALKSLLRFGRKTAANPAAASVCPTMSGSETAVP